MPFYDYKCRQCGKKFEVSHGMGGKPAGLRCEFCASFDLQRIFQPVGMMRKGETDFSDNSNTSPCSSCSSASCSTCA